MTLASSEIFLFCPAAASCTALTRSAIWLSVCLKRFSFSSEHTQRAKNSPNPKLVYPILGRVQVQQVHLLRTQTDRSVRSFAGCHAAFPIVLWLLVYWNISLKCVLYCLLWESVLSRSWVPSWLWRPAKREDSEELVITGSRFGSGGAQCFKLLEDKDQ